MDDCFIISDVHGHIDRLEALLIQEGLMDELENRLRPEVRIIQTGDLGHFGMTRDGREIKSQTADLMCYTLADELGFTFLWGNHDRAVISPAHEFGGYVSPPLQTEDLMHRLADEGRYLLATEAHGFLITHAGLHKEFIQKTFDGDKTNPGEVAIALNSIDSYGHATTLGESVSLYDMRDAISHIRGGPSHFGGILWRDARESLYGGFRQIFGHTAKDEVRKYQTPAGYSYCLDTGTAMNGQLAAMWLPSETIAKVEI